MRNGYNIVVLDEEQNHYLESTVVQKVCYDQEVYETMTACADEAWNMKTQRLGATLGPKKKSAVRRWVAAARVVHKAWKR